MERKAQKFEADWQFDAAAAYALQHAEQSANLESYLNAARLMIAAEGYGLAMEISSQLIQAGHQSPMVLRLFFTSLVGVKNDIEAKRVAELLAKQGDATAITLSQMELPYLPAMARNLNFRAQIIEAISCSQQNRIYFELSLHCRECGEKFLAGFKHSIFRLHLCACPQCARPAVVVPLDLSRALEQSAAALSNAELVARDRQYFQWVNQWWRPGDRDEFKVFGRNIFEMLYFHIRYGLSDVLARVLARQSALCRGRQ